MNQIDEIKILKLRLETIKFLINLKKRWKFYCFTEFRILRCINKCNDIMNNNYNGDINKVIIYCRYMIDVAYSTKRFNLYRE